MNNNLLSWLVFFVLLMTGSAASSESSRIIVELEAPRAYGYSLGDKITLKTHIKTPLFYQLETGFLPNPGPLNDWLKLDSVELLDAQSGFDYALALTYQVFKSVDSATELTIPALPIRFSHTGTSETEHIPAWTFGYSPLLPKSKADAQIQPEPELSAVLISPDQHALRLTLLWTCAAIILLYIVWFYGKIPFLERYSGAFGQACRDLKKLKKLPPSQETSQKAMQCFHRALNQLAGETVFAAQLPEFFNRFPQFKPLQDRTGIFFQASERLFFSSHPDTKTMIAVEKIEELCLLYRKLERSRRWI
ncbi:hypothetical protein [Methylicorpusculum sp.]|uniref:hypothetical protein n=1 Tax=Methylicorpusculum sp. TaxID=2713644 RepID=UPI0027161485|nr:hypothetical protein [Methylicorpusculum sp.]MDO8844975.1 hypothetical protein [Methylicorpusculum sp.]